VPIPTQRPRRALPPLGAALLLWAGWAVLLSAAAGAGAGARGPDWLRPVPGDAARPFAYRGSNPFAAGQHRGLDLAAAPGTRVRAACPGRVRFAGRVPGLGRAVSVRCDAHRVVYLPLRSVRVRPGAFVAAGSPLGTVAAGHGGALHLGVRREGRRFGYVDPAGLLGEPPPPALGPVPRPAPPARVPAGPRPSARPAPARAPAPAPVPGVAPWPVWLGLALLLTGAAGSRTLTVRRRRRSAARLRPAGVRR